MGRKHSPSTVLAFGAVGLVLLVVLCCSGPDGASASDDDRQVPPAPKRQHGIDRLKNVLDLRWKTNRVVPDEVPIYYSSTVSPLHSRTNSEVDPDSDDEELGGGWVMDGDVRVKDNALAGVVDDYFHSDDKSTEEKDLFAGAAGTATASVDGPTVSRPEVQSSGSEVEQGTEPAGGNSRLRVISFGDLHGDMGAFIQVKFLIERTVPESEKENTIIVCLGDIMDRGPDDFQIIDEIELMKQEGYRIHVILGNHEAMVASGEWGYRNMYRDFQAAESEARVAAGKLSPGGNHDDVKEMVKTSYMRAMVEKEKENVLVCVNRDTPRQSYRRWFNTLPGSLVFKVPGVHNEALLFAHGGFTTGYAERMEEQLVDERAPVGLEEMVQHSNAKLQQAKMQSCISLDNVPDEYIEFQPTVNTSPIWNDENRAITNDRKRTMRRGPDGVTGRWAAKTCVDKPFKEYQDVKMLCEVPSESRQFYLAVSSARSDTEEVCDAWAEYMDNVDPAVDRVRQVVGHTPEAHKARGFCNGRLFGVDTRMSNSLCQEGENCPYSILIMENFGSPKWATNPIIVRRSLGRLNGGGSPMASGQEVKGPMETCEVYHDADAKWAPLDSCDNLIRVKVPAPPPNKARADKVRPAAGIMGTKLGKFVGGLWGKFGGAAAGASAGGGAGSPPEVSKQQSGVS